MNRFLHILFLVVIWFISLYAHTSYGQANSTGIHGTIFSNEGQAIHGASVRLVNKEVMISTNIDGQYAFNDLILGTYQLEVTAFGYRSTVIEISVESANVKIVDFVLEPIGQTMSEILISGKSDRMFAKIPGSASFLSNKELTQTSPLSGNEVFRRTTGLHVVDEEGVGMRANIGIRGLDPDRSRTVLVLEDGIPIALAPYGEPEMYYTPPIDRMSSIEIIKGSGQILYGPQTIGGVINYRTKTPPNSPEGSVKLQSGNGGYLNGLLSYGNTIGNTGFQVSVLKKRADKIGQTKFDITDISAKLNITLSSKSSLVLKAGFYNEISNATYIGLTQSMFDAKNQDFVLMAPDDLLKIRRYNFGLLHEYSLSDHTKIKTVGYAYTTSRDWRRQDFVSNDANDTKPSNWTGITWGDESITGGAIYMRNGTGNRNRSFDVAGIESSIVSDFTILGKENQIKAGLRYHVESAHEQRINGSAPSVSSGALVEDEVRSGNAISGFIQNQIKLTNRLDLSFGARMEYFDYSRDIARRTFKINSINTIRDTSLVKSNMIHQLIPGAGLTWTQSQNLNFFAGVHMGFAPPRTKDAISDVGEVYDLNAERSLNWEMGLRSKPTNGIQLELTGFYMDFSNQIIPVSESSGGTGTGLVNGGESVHRGIESAIKLDISNWVNWSKSSLLFDINLTFVDAKFKGERVKSSVKLDGKRTPYAPNLLINSAVTYTAPFGLSVRFVLNHVGNQYTDELNTVLPSPDGRIGRIDAYQTVDATLLYEIKKWHSSISLSCKNISDERYMVSRRPQGIRVGLDRFVTFGIEHRF